MNFAEVVCLGQLFDDNDCVQPSPPTMGYGFVPFPARDNFAAKHKAVRSQQVSRRPHKTSMRSKGGRVSAKMSRISHIPADLVVTSRSSHNPIDLSTCYPHYVSSAPTLAQTEMRHATGRQTQTPKSHHHRRFP